MSSELARRLKRYRPGAGNTNFFTGGEFIIMQATTESNGRLAENAPGDAIIDRLPTKERGPGKHG
jgi:hypothetical protein